MVTTEVATPTAVASGGKADSARLGSRLAAGLSPLGAAAVFGAIGIGAVLRFGDLGRQGFWYDESFTAYFVHLDPGEILRLVPLVESTPPLYYGVAWLWSQLFGSGEAALRSLSALAGTATIPLAYLLGRRLVSGRVGAVAAWLTATSPLLVWYSQEARSYMLLVLVAAAGLLAFLRALEAPGRRTLAGWAAVSALALATHYYALLAVIPQAAWLAVTHRCRHSALAVCAVAAAGGALLPLAAAQRSTRHADWIASIPFERRLSQLFDQLLAGFGASPPLLVLAGAGLAASLALLLHARRGEWRRALVPGALVVGGAALALVGVALGADFLITRNLIVLWLPLALVAAVGMGSRRAGQLGIVATAAVCLAWAASTLSVDAQAGLQRPDWRRVSAFLGQPRAARILLLERYRPTLPLALYQPGLVRLGRVGSVAVRELDLVAPRVPRGRSCWWGAACNLHNARLPGHPPPGFRLTARVRVPNFAVARFVSPQPRRVSAAGLRRLLRRYVGPGAILLQRPGRQRSVLWQTAGRDTAPRSS